MKVYRGSRWQSLTDSFGPAEYLDDLEKRDITLVWTGTMMTTDAEQIEPGLEIEDPDVVALFEGFRTRKLPA